MATGALNVRRNDYIAKPKNFEIFTPPDICNFIEDIISVNKYKRIADICSGPGNLSKPFVKKGCEAIGADTIDYSKEFPGKFINFDFLSLKEKFKPCLSIKESKLPRKELKEIIAKQKEKYEKELNIKYEAAEANYQKLKEFKPELIVCNPPWNKCPSRKLYPFEILKKITEIFGIKIPFIIFTPMGLRLNRRYGASRDKIMEVLIEQGCEITSICSMPIDAFFPGNKVKGQQWEILFFNIPNIKAHYWYTDKTREKYGKI
jgi:hypothetical protein